MPARAIPQSLTDAVRYWEPIFEIGTGDEVLAYLAEGRFDAAAEIADRNAYIHYGASNIAKGDGLNTLVCAIRIVQDNAKPSMTVERARQILSDREGTPPEHLDVCRDDDLIAAALMPEGQPCADCGALVVYRDDDWQHISRPTGCFLARADER